MKNIPEKLPLASLIYPIAFSVVSPPGSSILPRIATMSALNVYLCKKKKEKKESPNSTTQKYCVIVECTKRDLEERQENYLIRK